MAFVGLAPRLHCRGLRVRCCSLEGSNDKKAKVEEAIFALRTDLPRQYDAVFSLDFSIFADDVTFDDPWTKIRGKLNYRGMLYTLAAIKAVFFSDAVFDLSSCELAEDDTKIRTRWLTKGRLRLIDREISLSGTDYFHLDDEGQIVRHESLWDS
ncbi:hypothetical protein NDN08_001498 [Rhodosorus marinus]|uniref:SnoaL-like domain-containing protein n=1 Tax=Rhodosorus marinus TaxID=101924 RepID=A0AAV8UR19_9RHOD|nr:hypothetical protein NDN08_001498 [Rhodosorus marinus]